MPKEITVKLNELKENMIIARDVTSELSGEVLVEKDKVVSSGDITKLKQYQIARREFDKIGALSGTSESAVWVQVGPEEEENASAGRAAALYLSKTEQSYFPEFKKVYTETEDRLKQKLAAIGTGEKTDAATLSQVLRPVLDTLPHKSSIFSFLNYVKQREFYTYAHCVNVALLCMLFGQWLNLCREDMEELVAAGMLHDIGMTRVPQTLITKHGKLTAEEFAEIRKHPQHSFQMIFNQPFSDEVKLAVLQHHERIDGSGYPKGLMGGNISLMAKIVAICDIYEAMNLERPYRDTICPFSAIKEFEQNYYGKLDTEFLMVFLKHIAYNYLDRNVRLTDGQKARVIFINGNRLSSPIVQLEDGNCTDLMFNRAVSIAAVL
ncbi:MAG: HD-GYP domain-containing protein [Clostridiales bacterium]|jgi:putative nucleotidyltransferase with HDIG domain|nr:HD-GYP domain-containing protein [Clostridiales bacterium]